jgi:hypothetical protein
MSGYGDFDAVALFYNVAEKPQGQDGIPAGTPEQCTFVHLPLFLVFLPQVTCFGLPHNSEICEVWQHTTLYGLNTHSLPFLPFPFFAYLFLTIKTPPNKKEALMDDEVREKRGVFRMLLDDYLRCSGGLAKQATGRKPVVCALCTHRPGGTSGVKT